MAETPQIIRQWTLLRTLSARRFGASIQELAAEADVTQKTIRRDLAALRGLGFRLEETIARQGRKLWSLSSGSGLVDLSLNLTDVLSLYVGQRLMEPLAGTMFWDGAHSSYRKIRATLGESAIEYLNRLASLLHFAQPGSSDYSERSQLIDQLMVAIEDRAITFLVYQSLRSTEPVSREIYPYGLAYFHGSLYLIAHAVEDKAIRHYKIDRVSDVEVQKLKFVRPEDFDLRQWLSAAFGVFRSDTDAKRMLVEFDRSVARFVKEKTWHPSQKLTLHPNGSITAQFELTDHEELSRWVLSFGSAARAIEPPELVSAIRGEVLRLAESYGTEQDSAR